MSTSSSWINWNESTKQGKQGASGISATTPNMQSKLKWMQTRISAKCLTNWSQQPPSVPRYDTVRLSPIAPHYLKKLQWKTLGWGNSGREMTCLPYHDHCGVGSKWALAHTLLPRRKAHPRGQWGFCPGPPFFGGRPFHKVPHPLQRLPSSVCPKSVWQWSVCYSSLV